MTIKVWCLPKLEEVDLNRLCESIIAEATSIAPLRDAGYEGKDNILVLFVPDSMTHELGTEILIEVSGLKPGPDCDSTIRGVLVKRLGELVKQLFPKSGVVCRAPAPDPRDEEFIC